MTQKTAPAWKVTEAPNWSHKRPATTLAASIALPLDRLNEGLELTRTRQWQRVAIQP